MKGCLTVIAVIIALIAGGGVLVWMNRDAITTGITQAFEQPEYGKKEHIDKHYCDLLRSMDAAATSASSLFSFGAAIEEMNLPEEVLFAGINKGENTTEVVKRFDWSGNSFFISGGYGSGTLSSAAISKNIMIYENNGPWTYMDDFVVYIEYKGNVEAASAE